jgi:cell wall assembly regulator SMI1
MGLFNDSEDNNRQDEVVIDVPEEDSSTETRLGKQVETDLIGNTGSESKSTDTGSNVSLEDIHSQNETIIDLLERLVNKGANSGSRDKTESRNSNRVTERRSKSSNRVTDRKDSSDNESIGDGINELL